MNENIKAFLKMLNEDAELQEKMSKVSNPDEAYAIASAAQPGFTKEEFVEVMRQGKRVIEGEMLSDDDLAKASGGWDWEEFGVNFGVAAGVAAVPAVLVTAYVMGV